LNTAVACATALGCAIYPILQFYAQNRGYTPAQATLRSFAASGAGTVLLIAIGGTAGGFRRSAVAVSVFLLMLGLYQGGLQAFLPRESIGAWLYLLASVAASGVVFMMKEAVRDAAGIVVGVIVAVLLISAAAQIAGGESAAIASGGRTRWRSKPSPWNAHGGCRRNPTSITSCSTASDDRMCSSASTAWTTAPSSSF
jgi:hypothetical protein